MGDIINIYNTVAGSTDNRHITVTLYTVDHMIPIFRLSCLKWAKAAEEIFIQAL